MTSSNSNNARTLSPPPYRDTYQIIRSSPFTEQDWAEASDTDAPADEWDEAEYAAQVRMHWMKMYEKTGLMGLRKMCKRRKLRVRGNKIELVERLASDDVRIMYGGGP